MARLFSQNQIRNRMLDLGVPRKRAKIMSAIAMVEAPGPRTDGHPTADMDTVGDQDLANATWGFSYGPFHIRSLRAHKGTGEYRDETRLLTPDFHFKSAARILHEQGLKAWSTYTSGAYKAYMPDEFPPLPGHHVVQAGETLSGIANKYETTWQELARINGLHAPYTLKIGQQVKVIS